MWKFFARANVNELSAHTKFHYSEAELLLHLWAAKKKKEKKEEGALQPQ